MKLTANMWVERLTMMPLSIFEGTQQTAGVTCVRGDLERDRHKVCFARKPEQQTQSLCCLDGSTQSLIRRGKRCPALAEERMQVVDCCGATWRQTMCDPKQRNSYLPSTFKNQRWTFARRRQVTSLLFTSQNHGQDFESSTLQLDFESVVLFSHTALLNQTLSRSTRRRTFYLPRPFTAIGAIPPFLNNPWVCHSVHVLYQYRLSLISQGFNVCSS